MAGYNFGNKTTKLMKQINPLNIFTFTNKVKENFGIKFTLMLSSVYYGLKGFLTSGLRATLLPYTLRVPLSAQRYQLIDSLSYIPWTIKGFFGILSDVLPLFGYQKKYYMLITCFLGGLTITIFVCLPFSFIRNYDLIAAILLFFPNCASSLCDLLCEGKFVQKMKEHPNTKAQIVIYVWWCQLFGGLLPSLFVGPMADAFDPRYIYVIYIPVCLQPIIFLYFNCMINDMVEPKYSNKLNVNLLMSKWKMFLLALLTASGAMGNFVVALIGSSLVQAIYVLIVSIILNLAGFFLIKKTIAKANLYMFLTFVLYLNIPGPLEYFYTADDNCVPGGPNFSLTFFKTYTGIVGKLFSLVGLWIYNLYITKLKFRTAFWTTTVVRVAASLFDIILTQRWNLQIGISDHVVYMLGNAIIYETANMLDFLPGTLLLAKLCPKDVEATVYAILASFANFGTSASSFIGIYLTDLFGIDSLPTEVDGTPCNFNKLTLLVFISHCLLPLICVPATFVLLPDAYIYDDLLDEKKENPKDNLKVNDFNTVS